MQGTKKIIPIAEFNPEQHLSQGASIAHCHGIFDLLHIGHIKHLAQAATFADNLVVSITSDQYVDKGPGRPVFIAQLRAEAVAALECVDLVIINDYPTAIECIKAVKPDFYVKGETYKNAVDDQNKVLSAEREAVESNGGTVVYTTGINVSSSALVNRYLNTFDEGLKQWMVSFFDRYSMDQIFSALDAIRNLKVLVLGEAIIDEYCYCRAMGKSGKEPILAAQYLRQERFIGGSLAVANHLAGICSEVHVITFLGENLEHQDFCTAQLKPNVTPVFLPKSDSPTIVKRRFLEGNQKIFEIYEMNSEALSVAEEALFLQQIDSLINGVDLVVVPDYGHGMITKCIASSVSEKAPFMAVNVQANAGNHGLNTIFKYPSADFITLASRELQLELRTNVSPEKHLPLVLEKMAAKAILVTRGADGLSIYFPKKPDVTVPAFTTEITDRVGAGDTVLSLTSCLAAQNVDPEIMAFLGNIVGAKAVTSMGNSEFIQMDQIKKQISYFFK